MKRSFPTEEFPVQLFDPSFNLIFDEEEANEISSLSDSNISHSEHRKKAKKRIPAASKRGKTIERDTISNEFLIRLNEPDLLRISLYSKFTAHHLFLLNSADIVKLKEEMSSHTASDMVTVQRFWPGPNKRGPAPANPMGQFNYGEFLGEDKLTYFNSFLNLVPDYLIQMSSPQVIVKDKITKAVCTLRFTGTFVATVDLPIMLAKDPNNNIAETRTAIMKADLWAPPEETPFLHERTIRKMQADDVIMEDSNSSKSTTSSLRPECSLPQNKTPEKQLIQMAVNLKGVVIYQFNEDNKLARLEYHYYE